MCVVVSLALKAFYCLRCNPAFTYLLQACIMGTGSELGCPIKPDDASAAIFGLVLLNDWSARDIQKWEMAPLGPFNGKNWVSRLSTPWGSCFVFHRLLQLGLNMNGCCSA